MSFSDFLLITGVIVLCSFIVYLLLRKIITKRVNPDFILREIEKEVSAIITELNATTDRNISILEDRVKGIEDLLVRADKKIGILRRENERLAVGKTYNDIVRRAPLSSEPSPLPDAGPVVEREESIREKVLRLHREGISPEAISGRINMPVGEVELIISLRGPIDHNEG